MRSKVSIQIEFMANDEESDQVIGFLHNAIQASGGAMTVTTEGNGMITSSHISISRPLPMKIDQEDVVDVEVIDVVPVEVKDASESY